MSYNPPAKDDKRLMIWLYGKSRYIQRINLAKFDVISEEEDSILIVYVSQQRDVPIFIIFFSFNFSDVRVSSFVNPFCLLS